MRKLIIPFVFSLTACANQQRIWTKDGATEQDFRTDKYECEKDARQSGYFGGGLVGAANMSGFASRCMEARGWSLEEQASTQESPTSDITKRENAEKYCEQKGFVAPSGGYKDCFWKIYQDGKI